MTENQTHTRHRPVIRIFVSSTFSDLKHERDALQQRVFPELERYCQRRHFQFQAIDLRWGVPTEAGLDHRTMQICFEELRRAQEISPQPNFLILLGNRYGWRPLPEEIFDIEYQELEKCLSNAGEETVLRQWYRRDENSIPVVYVLRSRHDSPAPGTDFTLESNWQPVQAALWDVINRAFPPTELDTRFEQGVSLNDSLPSMVRFQTSATEQEIWRGAFCVPNAAKHVFSVVRTIENLEDHKESAARKNFVDLTPAGAVDQGSQDALRDLKRELRGRLGKNCVDILPRARLKPGTDPKRGPILDVTTDHLTDLCDQVGAFLAAIITRQIDAYWATTGDAIGPARALELEQNQHQRFGLERAPEHSFVGRERELRRIHQYLHNDAAVPLVIHGRSGSGKTALLARAAQEAANERRIIVRYLGVTPRSSDARSLLGSLCQELRQRHPVDGELPGDFQELIQELTMHLGAATPQEPVVLFLDALDQLSDSDHGRSLFWVPQALPEHVKLVVSCLSDRAERDPAGEPFAALARRQLPREAFMELDVLSEAEARELLFMRWLPQANRRLNEEQTDAIEYQLKAADCREPLYLKILFEEARLWRSYDAVAKLGDDVTALLASLFERLAATASHGPTVAYALGYLASARRGLTETEILEVLYRELFYEDSDYKKFLDTITKKTNHTLPENPPRVPIAIWSRLRYDLAPYLAEIAAPGGTVLNFYHRQVSEYVAAHFPKRHDRLVAFFDQQDYFAESLDEQRDRGQRLPPTPRPAGVRKVDELPWQLVQVAKISGQGDPQPLHWDAVADLFTDLHFLEAKAEAGMIFSLAQDYADTLAAMPAQHLRRRLLVLLDEAIRRDLHFLDRHPTTLFQSLWNTCWWYDCPEAARHYDLSQRKSQDPLPWERPAGTLSEILESWRARKEVTTPGFSWLRLLRPPQPPLGSGLQAILSGHVDEIQCLALSPDATVLASSSSDRTIRLWDIGSGRCVGSLCGHEEAATALVWNLDGTELISVSGLDLTIRVWDYRSARQLQCINYCVLGPPSNEGGGALCPNKCIAFCPQRRYLVICTLDGKVRLLNIASIPFTFIRCLPVNEGHILTSVCFSPNGQHLAVCGGDGKGIYTTGIYAIPSGALVTRLQGTLCGSALYVSERVLLVSSPEGDIQWWDLKTAGLAHTYNSPARTLPWTNPVTSSSRNEFLLASLDGTVHLGSAAGVLLRTWHCQMRITSVALLPNGQILVGGEDGSIHVWSETSQGNSLALIGGADTYLGFSANGRIAASRSGATFRVWDARTMVPLRQYTSESGNEKTFFLFVPEGSILIFAPDEGATLRFQDLETGNVFKTIATELRPFTCSPDGRLMAGCSSGRLWVLDMNTKSEVLSLGGFQRNYGFRSSPRCLCFSDDGRYLFGGQDEGYGSGGRVRMWTMKGEETLLGPSETVGGEVQQRNLGSAVALAFSPEKNALIAQHAKIPRFEGMRREYAIRVWDIATKTETAHSLHRSDIRAIAGSSRRYPWLPSGSDLETALELAATLTVVGWLPLTFNDIWSHPSGRMWLTQDGAFFELVGDVDQIQIQARAPKTTPPITSAPTQHERPSTFWDFAKIVGLISVILGGLWYLRWLLKWMR